MPSLHNSVSHHVQELVRFCKDVPHQDARAIRCLQDNFSKPQFSGECRTEVALYEQRLGNDYRFVFTPCKTARFFQSAVGCIGRTCHYAQVLDFRST